MELFFNHETTTVAEQTVINRTGACEVKALSAKGKFSISKRAMEMIDFDPTNEDHRLVIMDMGAEQAKETGVRFAICKGWEVDGEIIGAKVNKQHQFSYSGIWNIVMFPNDTRNLNGMTNDKMAELGLVRKTKLKNGFYRYSSTNTVYFKATEITHNGEVVDLNVVAKTPEGDPIERKVLLLTDREEKDLTREDIENENTNDDITMTDQPTDNGFNLDEEMA